MISWTANRTLRNTFRIVFPYLVIGIVYISVSDNLVSLFSTDPTAIAKIQTYKGWGFIILTSVLLFAMLYPLLKKLDAEKNELNQTQALLKKSEELLRLQFKYSADAILLTGPSGAIYSANMAACKMFERSEEEICLVGRNGLIDLDDPNLPDAIEKRRKTGSFSGELGFRRKDGTRFPCEITSTIFRDGDGVEKTSMIIRDISERKIVEEAIQTERDFSNALLDGLPGIFYLFDQNMKFLRWNKNFEFVSGYSDDEIEKMNPLEFFTQAEKDLMEEKFTDVFTHNYSEVETYFLSKSGNVTPYYINGLKIKYNNQDCLIGIGIDITQRKQAEQNLKESEKHFRTLFEQASDGIFVSDKRGKFLDVNTAGCKMMGFSNAELLKMSFADIIGTEEKSRVEFEMLSLSNTVKSKSEWIVKRKDGTKFIGEMTIKQLNDGRYQAFLRDATQRKEAEEAIRKRNSDLATLFETSLFLLESLDKKTILQNIVGSAIKLIGLESGEIYLIAGENLVIEATTPPLQANLPDEFRTLKPSERSNVYKAILTSSPVVLADVQSADLTDEEKLIVSVRNFQSLVYLPLLTGKEVFGLLVLGTQSRKNIYTEHEIDLCRTLSNLTSIALEKLILFEKLNKNIVELKHAIVEKNLAVEALIESEQRFRSMFENHTAVMLQLDPKTGKIIDANIAAREFYGYSISELQEMQISDINMLPSVEIDNILLNAAIQSSTHSNLPHRLKSGEIRKVEAFSTPIPFNTGTILFAIIHDVTERKLAEEAVLKTQEQLRALSARLEEIREDERINIARELHDNLGQSLTALKMDVTWLTKKIRSHNQYQDSAFIEKANTIQELIDNLIDNVKRISSELRPNMLEYLGLIPSLEWLMEDFKKRTELECRFITRISSINLAQRTALSVFRIFQEALTNIIRHSGATIVALTMEEDESRYIISISDNGKGIEQESLSSIDSLGIIGMHERALQFHGELSITGNKDTGTTVALKIPKEAL